MQWAAVFLMLLDERDVAVDAAVATAAPADGRGSYLQHLLLSLTSCNWDSPISR